VEKFAWVSFFDYLSKNKIFYLIFLIIDPVRKN
jgi:hypothetical protein